MDPTLDPIPTGTAPRVGGSPPDLAAVVARVELIERRLDTLERGQRPTIASLPARAHRRPTIEPIHTIAATPDPVRPAAAAPGVAPAPFVAPAPMATTIAPPTKPPAVSRALSARAAPSVVDEVADEPRAATPGRFGGQPTPTEPARPWVGLPDLASVSPGRLLAWVGGAALVLGAVFFLSLAFSRGWITEPMRVLVGLASGIVLLGASVVTFDRRGPVVAHVLAAAGIAILELSLYSARLFGLVPAEVALLGAAVVAAAAMTIAIRFDSQPVAALGLLAVLAAPPIMQAPATMVTVAFLFLVLVAVAVVAVARGWRWLTWLAFATTVPQLLAWLAGPDDVPFLIRGVALLGYWVVLGVAAIGELWLRPRALRGDPTSALLVSLDVAVVLLLGIAADDTVAAGVALLGLGAFHVVGASPFLVRRDRRDVRGQLLIAAAAPWLTIGLALAPPHLLVPIGWAVLAAMSGLLSARWQHAAALVEALIVSALVAGWVAIDMFPLTRMLTSAIPPVGMAGHDLAASLFVVVGLLAVIVVAARWSAVTHVGRSAVLAAGVILVAWMLPFEIGGLWLVAAWTVLAVGVVPGAIRLFGLRLRRLTAPTDVLLLTGAVTGALATFYGIVGFPLPTGTVDLLAPVVVDRLLASLLPVVGLVGLVLAIRPTWWRGALAATSLLLLTLGVWLVSGRAILTLASPVALSLDGTFVVLVGWCALALAALVLDERPHLRLASPRLLTRDPAGHPLALTAVVPAIAALLWLTGRFLVGGSRGALPAVPFTDVTTIATGLVVGFLMVATAAARTTLVRAILVVTAVVLIAVLLPIELPLAVAVTGWSLMAAGTRLFARRLTGPYLTTATALGAGLIAAGIAATLLVIAPPDRLFLELTRTPPDAGPPNAATLATVALAGAFAVLAWCRRGIGELAAWLWLGAGAALAWGVSVGIADAFAMRITTGAEPVETARQAQVALSIAWATMGLVTMLLGLLRDIGPARQAGLTLLAVATVKVFVYDLATLDIAYRVLSLVGLGVLLLVSAWFYLHARHRGGPQAMGH